MRRGQRRQKWMMMTHEPKIEEKTPVGREEIIATERRGF